VSFLSTRILQGCGVADLAVPVHGTFLSSCLSGRVWGRGFMLRLVWGLFFSFNENLKAILDTLKKISLYQLMKCPWN